MRAEECDHLGGVGVKGGLVCGRYHKENKKHTRDEFTADINMLKALEPSELVTIDNLEMITKLCAESPDPTPDEYQDDQDECLKWAEYDESDVYLVKDEMSLTYLSDKLVVNAFVHGSTYIADHQQAMRTINASLSRDSQKIFDSVRLDTWAKKASVIYRQQYVLYGDEFGKMTGIYKEVNRCGSGIGVSLKAFGTVKMQLTFYKQQLVIYVEFLVLDQRVTT